MNAPTHCLYGRLKNVPFREIDSSPQGTRVPSKAQNSSPAASLSPPLGHAALVPAPLKSRAALGILTVALIVAFLMSAFDHAQAAPSPFQFRGYYMTFMRMPALGLAEWKQIVDFYPEADGLMIESSDYAICFCSRCREHFFDYEFKFVRQISNDLWAQKPIAMIVVYPHYFSARKVPGFDVTGAKQPFDPRWSLFFTPHSAHIDPALIAQSKTSVYWNEGLTLGTPAKIREGAQLALKNRITGFIPSLEPFTCPTGPPDNPGPAMKPFHFQWLDHGQMPLNELLIRVNRIAYRAFARNPQMDENEFKKQLGQELIGPHATPQTTDDLLFLQETYFLESDWFRPSPMLQPERLKDRASRENWSPDRLATYTQRIERLKLIRDRYTYSPNPTENELARLAHTILAKW